MCIYVWNVFILSSYEQGVLHNVQTIYILEHVLPVQKRVLTYILEVSNKDPMWCFGAAFYSTAQEITCFHREYVWDMIISKYHPYKFLHITVNIVTFQIYL